MESYHTIIYNAKEISLPKLRILIQRQEPPATLRPIIWKLLLGYLPISSDRFEILKIKRKKYHKLASRYSKATNDDHLHEQIRMDAIRTHIKQYKNLFELPSIQEILIRVPFVLSKENHCDYFQGITDICAVLLLVFSSSYCDYHDLPHLESEYWADIEADLYYCIKTILDWMSPHLASSLLEGFKPSLDKLNLLIKLQDPSLHSWFQEQQIEPLHFAVRWFLLLMSREFNFDCVMRLFDIYFAIGKPFFMYHVYVCASTLLHFSPMLKCLEFNELLPLLQKLPTADWDVAKIEDILANAKQLMKIEEEFADQILYVVGIPTLSVYLTLYTQFVTYVLYEASVNKN